MSEKHLTEPPWKALVVKKKLKDTDLTKALIAYNKAADDDYDARISALDGIEKAANSLKKEQKGDADITDHLGDVLTEVGKARKTIEAAKKSGGDEGAEDEGDEGSVDPAVIKKRMISLLNQVKSKAPEDPQLAFMACLAGAEAAVLLARSVGATQKKALLEMLPNASGPKFVEGECRWEENTHTFVLEAIPGGLAQKISKALAAETGVKYKVRVRKPDGSGLVDSDAEADPNAAPGSTAVPPPPPPPKAGKAPPPPAPGQLEFATLLRTLKPNLDKVVAGKPPVVNQVTALFQEVSELAKARNFVEANQSLKELAAWVKTGLEQLTNRETGGQDGEFKKRLGVLAPKIKEAIAANGPAAAELRLRASEAGALAKQRSFAEANAVLDQIEKLLGGQGTPQPAQKGSETTAPTPPAPPPTSTEQTPPPAPPPPTATEQTPPPAPPPGTDDQSKWNEKFAALEPQYLEALKGGVGNPEAEELIARLKTMWAFATGQAEAGAQAKALAAFQRIESENLFEAIAKAKSGSAAQPTKGLVEKRKFMLTRWKEIPPQLLAELEVLKKQIAADLPDDDVADLSARMDRYMETLLSGIQAKFDQAINAGDMSIIKGIKDEYEGDELIQHLVANPFTSGAKFHSVVLGVLEEIESNLAA